MACGDDNRCHASQPRTEDAPIEPAPDALDAPPSPPPDARLLAAAYMPTAVGNRWTYSVTQTGNPPSYTENVMVTRSSATEFDLDTKAVEVSFSDQATYISDASGIAVSRSITTISLLGTQVTFTRSLVPAAPVLAGDLSPGSMISTTSTVTVSNGQSTSQATLVTSVTVNGPESLSVPAGTFSALKVTSVTADPMGSMPTTVQTWWVRDLGWVKQIIDSSSDGNHSTAVLTSHQP